MYFNSVFILIFLLLSFLSYGQNEFTFHKEDLPTEVAPITKSNPLAILWGPIPVTAEYRLLREINIGEHQSIQVGVSYLGKNPLIMLGEALNNPSSTLSYNNPITRITTYGYRFQVSHRTYTSNDAPYGFYFGPHISYSQAWISTKYFKSYQIFIRASHFNVNMLMGYQFMLWDTFYIDLFAGLGYKKNVWEENTATGIYQAIDIEDIPFYNWPVKFTLGTNIGLSF